MLIVADKNIPLVEQAFSGLGDLQLVDGRHLSRTDIKKADALLVRSVSKINAELITDSSVKFVGSATSGIDHIDVTWLQKQGIAFAYTPGNNAQAVAEFVISSLQVLSDRYCVPLTQKVLGVVGYGNIGKRVVALANLLGMECLINDPYLQEDPAYSDTRFHSLADLIRRADIVSLHTPLTRNGKYPTWHLLDTDQLDQLKEGSWLINTARGAVVDGQPLLGQLQHGRLIAALDVWENEPQIDVSLLQQAALATPHVAGYSLEGKLNATASLHKAFCRFFSLPADWQAPLPVVDITNDLSGYGLFPALRLLCRRVCDIEADDRQLRRLIDLPAAEQATYFDQLRLNYRFRREFAAYRARLPSDGSANHTLRALGFSQLP